MVFEVDKSFKILIRASSAAEYIEYDIYNTEASRIDDPIILYLYMRKHTEKVYLKEFLKLFKCLAFSSIYTITR